MRRYKRKRRWNNSRLSLKQCVKLQNGDDYKVYLSRVMKNFWLFQLLAIPKQPEAPPTRDEWMTTLPPERKAGVPMHSTTSFSMNGKEGRGDTSVWTDSPLDRAQKAQQNYLEAYDKAKAIADGCEEKGKSSDASLVDKYNSSKRSVSLVQKHRESKKEKKKHKQREKEEWEERSTERAKRRKRSISSEKKKNGRRTTLGSRGTVKKI